MILCIVYHDFCSSRSDTLATGVACTAGVVVVCKAIQKREGGAVDVTLGFDNL